MAEELYRIVLNGYSSEKGEIYIEEDFAKLFNISYEKSKALFQSLPKTVKENLSFEQASQYVSRIKEVGAECEMESMKFDTGGLSLE